MNSPKVKQAIKKILKEYEKKTPEELKKEFDQHEPTIWFESILHALESSSGIRQDNVMKIIDSVLKQRKSFIVQDQEKFMKEIDRLADKVIQMVTDDFDELPVEYVLETLTHLGCAPSLLYDDNGMWAIVSDGTQPCVSGRQRIKGVMTYFCERNQWQKSIREAIRFYLRGLING